MATLHHGDCLEVLRGMADASVDAIVTDPPYGLSFMGKKWDYDVPSADIWRECLRVLKPGGHLLAFAGTRTQHRMAVNIEDAGFEIRDMITWVYGSGFPKSLDVSMAIDKAAGVEREVVGSRTSAYGTETATGERVSRPSGGAGLFVGTSPKEVPLVSDEAITPEAKRWQGWGTALKPALEPITVARKPLIGTVAENVLAHGTGAINVDACRVGVSGGGQNGTAGSLDRTRWRMGAIPKQEGEIGRWPANLIHDGSEEVVGLFPSGGSGSGSIKVSSGRKSGCGTWAQNNGMQRAGSENTGVRDFGDSGSAARFFYCAKASKADRDEGCERLETKARNTLGGTFQDARPHTSEGYEYNRAPQRNHHPTVKPTALMRYLCRLVTPPRGIVLDPFMGSGSTGKAATLEGFQFIGIEREEEYIKIAKARIDAAFVQQDLFAA